MYVVGLCDVVGCGYYVVFVVVDDDGFVGDVRIVVFFDGCIECVVVDMGDG